MLTEKKIHAVLQSGFKTLSFSADAADEENYSKLRVNGNLNKILKNICKYYILNYVLKKFRAQLNISLFFYNLKIRLVIIF